MKKLKLILVTLLSLLLLAACGSKKSSGEVTTDPSTLAKHLFRGYHQNRGFQRLYEHRRFCLRGRCHQMQ